MLLAVWFCSDSLLDAPIPSRCLAMAFSDELELIDQIRHELRIEDDSGTCARVVAPERRWAVNRHVFEG